MTSPGETPLDLETCSWGVTRGGIFEPCDKPAVAWQLDEEAVEFGAYPVCPAHTRVGRALPLKRDTEAVTLAAEVRRLRSELKSVMDAYETSHESRMWAERVVRRQEDENAALLAKVESMRRSRPRTVGDLTARDLGRRVRIGPWPREATFSVEGKVLSLDMHHGRETIVMLYDGRISPWPLDTPVEFLDDEPELWIPERKGGRVMSDDEPQPTYPITLHQLQTLRGLLIDASSEDDDARRAAIRYALGILTRIETTR